MAIVQILFYTLIACLTYFVALQIGSFEVLARFILTFGFALLVFYCLNVFNMWVLIKSKKARSFSDFENRPLGHLMNIMGGLLIAIGFAIDSRVVILISFVFFWFGDSFITKPRNPLLDVSKVLGEAIDEVRKRPLKRSAKPIFQYEEGSKIPVLAKTQEGELFTGKTGGTEGALDWVGNFEKGKPHGEFKLYMLDRPYKTMTFEYGVLISELT